jgi:hypothetical protein
MKMADLKAFVETKLLSKSEKTLEKIGCDEPKMFYGQVMLKDFNIAYNMDIFILHHLCCVCVCVRACARVCIGGGGSKNRDHSHRDLPH